MKHSFYLAAGICLMFSMSACQSNPQPSTERSTAELEATLKASDKATESSIMESTNDHETETVPTLRAQTPLTYKDTWTAGDLTWEIDAEVVVPDRESMPMLRGNWQEEHLDQELVDRVIEVFFGDRDYYSFDIDPNLVNGYESYVPVKFLGAVDLESTQCKMVELEKNRSQFSDEDYDNLRNEYMNQTDSIIGNFHSIDYDKMLKNQYIIANSVYPYRNIETTLDEVEVYSPNEDGLCDRLQIKTALSNSQKRNYVTYTSNDLQHNYSITEEEMTFSRNQAVQKCEEYLQALGIEFLEVQAIRFEYGYYQVDFCLKENAGVPSIPWLYTGESVWLHADNEAFFMDTSARADFSAQQDATIWLDENHVAYLSLPLSELVLEETGSWSELISFDEIISKLKCNFEEAAAHRQEQDMGTGITFINKIYLTNAYVQTTPLGSPYEERIFQSIPVWVLVGDYKENRQVSHLSGISLVELNAYLWNKPEIYAYGFACNPEEVNFTVLDLSEDADQLINQANSVWYRCGRCFYFTDFY